MTHISALYPRTKLADNGYLYVGYQCERYQCCFPVRSDFSGLRETNQNVYSFDIALNDLCFV